VARVLRLPGFYNHKYRPAYLVTAEARSAATRNPDHFPRFAVDDPAPELFARSGSSHRQGRGANVLSQSERDWAYAKRALGRGEPESCVTEEIARYRAGQKHDPHDYAQRTVRKAVSDLDQVGSHQGPQDEGKQR